MANAMSGKEKENVNAKQEGVSKLLRILPIAFDKDSEDARGEKGLTRRHWQADKSGRFFAANLSAEKLKPLLAKEKVKLENVLLKTEEDFIVYQYKGRSVIKLNLKDGQFYMLRLEAEKDGKEAAENQAHIVLTIIKKHGYSNAVIGKPIFQSNARQVLSKLKTYDKNA